MKLVIIEWIDSHSGESWQTLEKIKNTNKPLYCRSVGWLVSENDKSKTIVPHISGEKNENIIHYGCGDMTIPTKAITKLIVVRKK